LYWLTNWHPIVSHFLGHSAAGFLVFGIQLYKELVIMLRAAVGQD